MQGRGFGEGRPSLGASPPGSAVENPLVNAGDTGVTGSIPGLGRSPGGGHGNPLQDSCLENPHGQRSLVGYSPWGCKESDGTEETMHGAFTCGEVGSRILARKKRKSDQGVADAFPSPSQGNIPRG